MNKKTTPRQTLKQQRRVRPRPSSTCKTRRLTLKGTPNALRECFTKRLSLYKSCKEWNLVGNARPFFFLTWTCLFLILFQKTEVKRLSITMGPWPYARHSQPLLVNYKLQRLSPINAGKSHGITPPNGSTVPSGLQACWSHWLGKNSALMGTAKNGQTSTSRYTYCSYCRYTIAIDGWKN